MYFFFLRTRCQVNMTTARPRVANLLVHRERLLVEKNDFLVIFQRGLVDLLVLLDATAHKDLPARAQHLLIVTIIIVIVIIIGIHLIIRVGVIIITPPTSGHGGPDQAPLNTKGSLNIKN